jgi:hypothetical protein
VSVLSWVATELGVDVVEVADLSLQNRHLRAHRGVGLRDLALSAWLAASLDPGKLVRA